MELVMYNRCWIKDRLHSARRVKCIYWGIWMMRVIQHDAWAEIPGKLLSACNGVTTVRWTLLNTHLHIVWAPSLSVSTVQAGPTPDQFVTCSSHLLINRLDTGWALTYPSLSNSSSSSSSSFSLCYSPSVGFLVLWGHSFNHNTLAENGKAKGCKYF